MSETSSPTSSDRPHERPHGRALDALRPIRFETGVQKWAEGSVEIAFGDTRVLVAASVDNYVPPFLKDTGRGWVTGEYAMLPRATHTRSRREVSKGRQSGRSLEIQRLIGRSLRSAVDLGKLGERSVVLDCDVVQADGGTRTASITGAWVALVQALAESYFAGDVDEWPVVQQVAAVSVGIVDGVPLLDLEYVEDSAASVDMNVVGTADGELIEVQGTGEESTFTRAEHDALLDLALDGIAQLCAKQKEILAPTLEEIEALRTRGRRRAEPRDEKSLWGRPGEGRPGKG